MMKNTKIMVVDDNRDICELVEGLLSSEGYKVICCTNPLIAEELIKKENPQLLITDMLMSGVDGTTLTKTLRSNSSFSNMKVIMMSAHPQALSQSHEAGADEYIAKPFDIDELSNKVKEVLLK